MNTKKLILVIIIIFFIVNLSANNIVHSIGIIIAEDQMILETFRSRNQKVIKNLAESVNEYEEVILHLGNKKVFTRGHPFFYKTSIENLELFANQLDKQDQEFYIWFLDSYGSESFLEIHKDYQEIIETNLKTINEIDLDYDGIVIDLEWINLGSGNNSEKYLEVVEYLSKEIGNKKLFVFTSIIDNVSENISRGYKEKEILQYVDNIIAMLYIKDGGFYLKDGKLKLSISSNRIEDLRKYFNDNNYRIAVSLEGGIILEREERLYFIKSTNKFIYNDKVVKFYTDEQEYYKVKGFIPQESFYIKRNDGIEAEITEEDRIHFLSVKDNNLLKEKDFIWEYYLIGK
jgi:hypothetical protein